MSVVVLLIVASLAVALVFLGGFVWSVRSGQYEDTLTPAMRVLAEDSVTKAGDKTASVPVLNQKKERQPSENK